MKEYFQKKKAKTCHCFNELGGEKMKTFVGLKAKAYSYFTDDSYKSKNGKDTKEFLIKTN